MQTNFSVHRLHRLVTQKFPVSLSFTQLKMWASVAYFTTDLSSSLVHVSSICPKAVTSDCTVTMALSQALLV